jgi:hypothetical protein
MCAHHQIGQVAWWPSLAMMAHTLALVGRRFMHTVPMFFVAAAVKAHSGCALAPGTASSVPAAWDGAVEWC